MPGIDLLRVLRLHDRTADVPVVVHSAADEPAQARGR